MRKTVATPDEYIANGGLNCPVCDSMRLATRPLETLKADCDYVTREVTCSDCRSSWSDIYAMTGYAGLQIKGA